MRYHDGALEGLEYAAADQITLRIRATSSELLTVKVTGLIDVFVELGVGNIVSDIFIWRLNEVPLAVSVPDGPWNTLFRGRARLEEDINSLSGTMKRHHPDCHFLHVLCSYGGTLAAVGRSIEIYVKM